ncbi:hypothetical protein KFV02_04065 [Desulfohalobiaceae bacterium Ax17]|uniref:hypothetical protein n=1 Tax=Desulfovulcanus ferrireducens TaxID=2831190 RepID=UPI00207BAAB7|nr:hypothetical protein [Desulfovulcanus ferrireducens]MBT8763102.1 hypothetical protein [Desulfovulcanus ferrireducens]
MLYKELLSKKISKSFICKILDCSRYSYLPVYREGNNRRKGIGDFRSKKRNRKWGSWQSLAALRLIAGLHVEFSTVARLLTGFFYIL